ncbi:glycosyltransferase family 39 protein, partial [bacterium]|nr:glycosyltransferase family 39 protein [bacterium]
MDKTIQKYQWSFLLLLTFLCLGVSTTFFCMRKVPHVDEVWSYMLSNKIESDCPFLFPIAPGAGDKMDNIDNYVQSETASYKAYFHHWHDGLYYKNTLTVQPEDSFSYSNVYHNQTLDVHPPLYYFLLHTICSFFPNQFSWWFAYSINIIFFVGSIPLIFFVAKEIGMRPSHALMASAFWGLTPSGIGEVCFLRMYMMLTFITICITYLQIRLIKEFNVNYAVAIFVLNILGFLTQYCTYIYVFFLTLFYVIYMLYKREIWRGISYGFGVLLSATIAIAVYPTTINHVFLNSYNGSITYSSPKSF